MQLERNEYCQPVHQEAGLQSDFDGGRVGGGPYSLSGASIDYWIRPARGPFGACMALRP